MPLFGSHLSIAGGYEKAAQLAGELGLQTVQIFTKNNNQWAAKPLTAEDVRLFQSAVFAASLQQPCSHTSYLINLASQDPELWQKSVAALVVELERAEALGLAGVVMHPGSHLQAPPEAGQAQIVRGIDEVHQRTAGMKTQLWLETTAGQGSCLGWRFEQIGELLRRMADPQRVGVCVDTCHIFAAGYPLQTATDYAQTMQLLDEHIGIAHVRAFHLNDSKKPLGSRVDRHEHIGEGFLGLEPFRHLLADPRFAHLPMYLETEKGERNGESLDAMNLRTLRSLMPGSVSVVTSPSTVPKPAAAIPAPAKRSVKRGAVKKSASKSTSQRSTEIS